MTLEDAEKILHDSGYITIDVTDKNRQLSDGCHAKKKINCRKNCIGYMCCNMLCISDAVKEQLS